ncbi:MAG: DNA repair protein RecN [Rhodospirillales bacterium]|nr:DNA repair protein RecN [Rhodospirillales bacterium]MBO6787236.1 DNA repair protein RecN [Rhodospirillales bacterium]
MLTRLSIRNVVLIDKLDLEFAPGLAVLTGETGAGKSIVLDALGLALGYRAEARLLRKGADQASVSAVFDVPANHPLRTELEEGGIDASDDVLILRRVLGQDGRTKSFVNDQPVSVGLLKRVGEYLVEIHGQFETQRLLDPAGHRALLDAYGGYDDLLSDVARAYASFRDMQASLSAAEEAARLARENEDFLRHAVAELEKIAPVAGEETALSEQRRMLQHGEQISDAITHAAEAIGGDGGAEETLARALAEIERVAEKAGGLLDDTLGALQRAVSEAADAGGFLERAQADLDIDPKALEEAEERLFALRALARKHGCEVDALAGVQAKLAADLADVDAGGETVKRLTAELAKARKGYEDAAAKLTAARTKAAKTLDAAMAEELAPLKLGQARFETGVTPAGEDKWSAHGVDRVAFSVATNPGSEPGPLNKIASGGELARFMLALKVVLAEADPVPVLVFDEVDAGIGGAVAAAVGERLQRLGTAAQIFVVTHSPQVAAKGSRHLYVRKGAEGDGMRTEVVPLDGEDRREEIARMLSGETVTSEARAAADSLLKGAAA